MLHVSGEGSSITDESIFGDFYEWKILWMNFGINFRKFRDETMFYKIFKPFSNGVLSYTSWVSVMVIGLTTQYSMTVANHWCPKVLDLPSDTLLLLEEVYGVAPYNQAALCWPLISARLFAGLVPEKSPSTAKSQIQQTACGILVHRLHGSISVSLTTHAFEGHPP